VGRAFNAALADAEGTLPIWLVLANLRGTAWPSQLELARAVGIEGPTLTRHLDGMEEVGLVRRVRDPEDRRAFKVELTDAGRALHDRLLEVVIAFNRRLQARISPDESATLRDLLARLEENVREE
jgi:MarR family transcriptional regulator for hemolysin